MSFGSSTFGGGALGASPFGGSSAGALVTSWPESLPLPFVDASGSPVTATVCSQLPDSRAARRSRLEKTYVSLAVSWVLTSAEFDALKTFFSDSVDNGAAAFVIPLRYPLNSILSDWIARFASSLKANHDDGHWMVAAQLTLHMRI